MRFTKMASKWIGMRFSVSFGAPIREITRIALSSTASEKMKTESILGAVNKRAWIGLSGQAGSRWDIGSDRDSGYSTKKEFGTIIAFST